MLRQIHALHSPFFFGKKKSLLAYIYKYVTWLHAKLAYCSRPAISIAGDPGHQSIHIPWNTRMRLASVIFGAESWTSALLCRGDGPRYFRFR